MKGPGVRKKRSKPKPHFTIPVFLLLSLSLVVISTPRRLAADTSDLASAAGHIAGQLTADLSAAPEGPGRVLFAIPPAGLVVKFEQPGARPDREYLLTREPEQPGAAFPLVIGAARLTEVREEVARGILLWSEAAPRPGDRALPPPRITLFLVPASDLARHPGASASLADQALELALSREPRLRVVPLRGQPDPDELAKRLKAAGEIGLLLEPLLLPDPAGVRLAAKARSVLSGQTTATYADTVALAPRAAQPSPPPPAPPSARVSPPPEREPIRMAPSPRIEADLPPPGFVITRKEAEPGEIVPAGEKPAPIRNDVTEALLAITAADLDGDGRPELVGISEAGAFAYRWTEKGFVPLTGYREPERFVRYLAVDAADINGNGQDEIFVTAILSIPAGLEMRNSLRSLVLELRGQALVPIAKDLPYFLRVARVPGQDRPLLLAQKMGSHDPFAGQILKLTWDGGRYGQEEPLALPGKSAWIYDMTVLAMQDGAATALASITTKGNLQVRRSGEGTSEGKETLGVVEHAGFLQTPRVLRLPDTLRAATQPRPEEIAERRVLSRRVLAASPLFGRGKVELITVANRVHYGLQVRLFGEPAGAASVIAYVESGERLEKSWETTPVEGTARDLALADFDGDGRRDVVLLSAIEDRASLSLFLLRPVTAAGPRGKEDAEKAQAQ